MIKKSSFAIATDVVAGIPKKALATTTTDGYFEELSRHHFSGLLLSGTRFADSCTNPVLPVIGHVREVYLRNAPFKHSFIRVR